MIELNIGICSTCDSSKICINAGNSLYPKWFCEEFDFENPPVQIKRNESDFSSVASDESKTNESEVYTGLCINCENREICKFNIPESGVWHCEEYK